jgi:hypothetical protein
VAAAGRSTSVTVAPGAVQLTINGADMRPEDFQSSVRLALEDLLERINRAEGLPA